MKKHCKKLFAALLAVCMLVGMAFAPSADDIATAAYNSDAYTYFSSAATVLPGDAIVAAFKDNKTVGFSFNGIFPEGSDFAGVGKDSATLYTVAMIDVLNNSKYLVPSLSDEEQERAINDFKNYVSSFNGFYEDGIKASEISEKNLDSILESAGLCERARKAVKGETTAATLAKISVAVKTANILFKDVKSTLEDFAYGCVDGNTQYAMLEALKVVNIAAEKAEEYAVANKSEDVKAIIASGFIDNLRSAYLEYAAANDIIKNDVTIDGTATLLANMLSANECAKYYFAIEWLTGSLESSITKVTGNAFDSFKGAENDEDADKYAFATVFGSELLIAAADYGSVLSAEFVTAAAGDQVNWYPLVNKLVSNITILDKEIADSAVSVADKWSLMSRKINDMTAENYSGEFANLVALTPFINGLEISFADTTVPAGAEIYITTDDGTLAFATATLGEDKIMKVDGLLPGEYVFLGYTDAPEATVGKLTVTADGKAVVALGGELPTPDNNGENKGEDNNNNTNTGNDNNAVTKDVPKTADSSVVVLAMVLCLAAAAAYVVTKKVRG